MKKALIGYSGLVGSSIDNVQFDHLINRRNIADFVKGNPEVAELYVAAGDARKWLALKDENSFRSNSEELVKQIVKIKAKKVILFSTIDVYDGKNGVVESVVPEPIHPYGKISHERENQILESFPQVQIIRLPGLFGKGLSKNFIFDLLNSREDYIYSQNLNSQFQYYDLSRLDVFVKSCSDNIVNLVTEPVTIKEILSTYVSNGFNELKFNQSNYVGYNVMTETVASGYHLSKTEVLADMKLFFDNYE